jgi:hypothetical protein
MQVLEWDEGMSDPYPLFSTSVCGNPRSASQSAARSTPTAAPRTMNASHPEQQSSLLTPAAYHSLTDTTPAVEQPVCFKACVHRLPGTGGAVLAVSLDQDAVSVLPFERRDGCPLETLSARFVTFLVDSASFDRSAFNFSALEAKWTDPQQRILLESAAGALASCAHSIGAKPGLLLPVVQEKRVELPPYHTAVHVADAHWT